ncbi:MAG: DUF3570 domain-containing protein [Steroidobacteraceae bacterium]
MAATDHKLAALAPVALATIGPAAEAATLPDDRADALYHLYDGGGVTVDGPSIMVRKKIGENYSVSANYYMDMVSSASIDVVTQASPYKETRQQVGVSVDALYGRTQYSLGYVNSEENDYTANTVAFDVSQAMFGDLTTVSFGFSRAWDEVRRNGDPGFKEPVDRWDYRFSVSQIVTPKLSLELAYEAISDEGYLNNPYRSARYVDTEVAAGYAWEPEVYPHTHTSNAVSLRGDYFLWYRAAIHGMYRFYSDSWGVTGNTFRLGYTHPIGQSWILEADYRWYDQTKADFYSDLFPYADSQNFLGRDKELSTFHSQMLTFGATWNLPASDWKWVQRSTLNLFYDYGLWNYEDYRNAKVPVPPEQQPRYSMNANVLRVFFSVWF